jgi:hypothetical protein
MANEVIIKGLSRLAYQFKTSDKFQEFITAFLQEFQDLYDSGNQLLTERYLETAIGVQLDGIGEIVGIDRPRGYSDYAGAFGYENDPTSLGYGDYNNSAPGGHYATFEQLEGLIDDTQYRQLIRAKIIKNQTAMTVDDTLRLISFAFDGAEVRYFLLDDLKPAYVIGKYINASELFWFDFFPVLIGIEKVIYEAAYNGAESFVYDGDTGLGYGDYNDSSLGGHYAMVLEY